MVYSLRIYACLSGRHPCLGMRFAKLEIKAIIALFLMQYDYKLVDTSGNPVSKLPGPNRMDLHKLRPLDHVCEF